jgi:membrane protease YdiL (CAAX protease family)
MSWSFFVTSLLAFFFLDAIVSVIVVHGDEVREELTSVSNVMRALVVPYAVSTLVACAVIQRLGWWDVVLRERVRARPWVWIVPISFVVASVALVDYGRLRVAGAAVALALLLGTLLIAVGEELMFRGVVLQALRDRSAETTAALVTALLFGASHFLAGPLNVVISALFGYLLYWCRRVSGGLAVPIIVHALWDFSVFTSWTTSGKAEAPAASFVLTLITLALLVLLALRRTSLSVPRSDAPAPL